MMGRRMGTCILLYFPYGYGVALLEFGIGWGSKGLIPMKDI